MVFHDAVTEQDEPVSSSRPSPGSRYRARPVREPDKEQAETELELSVRERFAARQQAYPEIEKLVQLRLQSLEQQALALLATESERARILYNQWGGLGSTRRARTT